MIVYGIKNCDAVKKAITYLNKKKIKFEFHDYKELGIESSKIKAWAKIVPLDSIVNKKSTTYRSLSDSDKLKLEKLSTAIPVIQANTSIIKRPAIEFSEKLILGFNESEYNSAI